MGITDLDKLVHSVRKAADAGAKVAESKDWLRKTLAGCAEDVYTRQVQMMRNNQVSFFLLKQDCS